MIEYKFYSDYKHSISDIDSLNSLLTQLTQNPNKLTAVKLEKISENNRLLLALDTDNKIIGMATLVLIAIPTGISGRIEDVVVDEKLRGQGIGTTLIKKLITEGKKLHLKRIDLTSKPARIEANKLYLSLDFARYETNVYRIKLNQ